MSSTAEIASDEGPLLVVGASEMGDAANKGDGRGEHVVRDGSAIGVVSLTFYDAKQRGRW